MSFRNTENFLKEFLITENFSKIRILVLNNCLFAGFLRKVLSKM